MTEEKIVITMDEVLNHRREQRNEENAGRHMNAQETWAESQQELYLARLRVGVAKGTLSALKITLKSLEIGFEEWRTKMVNAREERKRYGA